MEITEFIEETSRIEKFFGKELEKFQMDTWYQELKNMPIERYRRIINQVYRTCKFMPKLADIISIESELPYIQNNTTTKKDRVDCEKCNGLGIIFYKKIINNGDRNLEYEYVARCNCENAKEFTYDGTKINDVRYSSKFYIPSAMELGL